MSAHISLRLLVFGAAWLASTTGAAAIEARVLTDEIILSTRTPNNGASPTWCVGAPLLVRSGQEIFASIAVTDPGAAPYCNTHWELWRRPAAGPWTKIRAGAEASEREPCPLFLLDAKSLVLSIQPKLLARNIDSGGEMSWFCQPALAVFNPARLERAPQLWRPEFGGPAQFSQHSYRSVGVDAANGSMLLLVIDGDVYRPTWRDALGAWHPLAPLNFPVRACYPDVVLRNRAAHVLAIGDIKEPNTAWKEEKLRVLKREWDYAFRRLFYAWSPDLGAEGFGAPIEIDSVDDTAGWMFNLDLLVDGHGRVHVLWVRRNFEHAFIRDRFFPGQPIVESVMHAMVEQGRMVAREALLNRTVNDASNSRPFSSGRMHELPDGRLVAVLATETIDEGPGGERGLFVQTLDPEAKSSAAPVKVAQAHPPAGWFFTNTPRGGSAPDRNLDLLGTETKDGVISVRYLHVLLQ